MNIYSHLSTFSTVSLKGNSVAFRMMALYLTIFMIFCYTLTLFLSICFATSPLISPNFFIRAIYRVCRVQCFLVSSNFQLCLLYLEIAEWKLSASSSSQTESCKDLFGCCNKFSSPLWNTDSFGYKVARSPSGWTILIDWTVLWT